MRWLVLAYGVACYVAFVAVFVAMALFSANAMHGIDQLRTGSLVTDIALIAVFGVSHSVLARPWAKRLIPASIERSTYVLVASASLALLLWQWRADPQLVWHVTSPAARALIWVAWGAGPAITLVSTFLTDHFDLFGLRQVWLYARDVPYISAPARSRLFSRRAASRIACISAWAVGSGVVTTALTPSPTMLTSSGPLYREPRLE